MLDRIFLAIAMLCGLGVPQCDILQRAQIVIGVTGSPSIAAYAKPGHVVVAPSTMTWPIQDLEIVLAHEGQHLLDFDSDLSFDCNVWEQRAVQAQINVYRRIFPSVTDLGPGGIVIATREIDSRWPIENQSYLFDQAGVSRPLIQMFWDNCD